VNSDHRDVRYMGDFLVQTQKNLKNPSPESGCLAQSRITVIGINFEMCCGKRDVRLKKMLFGSPSNASSSFSRSFAVVFSGYFFKT